MVSVDSGASSFSGSTHLDQLRLTFQSRIHEDKVIESRAACVSESGTAADRLLTDCNMTRLCVLSCYRLTNTCVAWESSKNYCTRVSVIEHLVVE